MDPPHLVCSLSWLRYFLTARMTTTAAVTVRAVTNIITATTGPVMTAAALLLGLGEIAELLLRTLTASMMYPKKKHNTKVCTNVLEY